MAHSMPSDKPAEPRALTLSTSCNKIPVRSSQGTAFERVPEDLSTIVTQLDLMDVGGTVDTYTSGKTRTNEITSSIVCTIASMYESSLFVQHTETQRCVFMVTDPLSVMYTAVIVYVFRHFMVNINWDDRVNMVVYTTLDTARAMVYSGVTTNVMVINPENPVIDLYRFLSLDTDTSKFVTHALVRPELLFVGIFIQASGRLYGLVVGSPHEPGRAAAEGVHPVVAGGGRESISIL